MKKLLLSTFFPMAVAVVLTVIITRALTPKDSEKLKTAESKIKAYEKEIKLIGERINFLTGEIQQDSIKLADLHEKNTNLQSSVLIWQRKYDVARTSPVAHYTKPQQDSAIHALAAFRKRYYTGTK